MKPKNREIIFQISRRQLEQKTKNFKQKKSSTKKNRNHFKLSLMKENQKAQTSNKNFSN
jgi:hypothetical protein